VDDDEVTLVMRGGGDASGGERDARGMRPGVANVGA
jgi:hypothetical protein